jgi:hypothetical protein
VIDKISDIPAFQLRDGAFDLWLVQRGLPGRLPPRPPSRTFLIACRVQKGILKNQPAKIEDGNAHIPDHHLFAVKNLKIVVLGMGGYGKGENGKIYGILAERFIEWGNGLMVKGWLRM